LSKLYTPTIPKLKKAVATRKGILDELAGDIFKEKIEYHGRTRTKAIAASRTLTSSYSNQG
jgi:hypothetical protein